MSLRTVSYSYIPSARVMWVLTRISSGRMGSLHILRDDELYSFDKFSFIPHYLHGVWALLNPPGGWARGLNCVLLFLLAKIVQPQSARGVWLFWSYTPVGWTRVQNLYAPGGLWEGCMMSQEIETSPPEHTPLWGGPMWALELNHPWIDPCEV